MSDYELLYFPARGRAEQVRLMFAYKGLPFVETLAKWPDMKAGTPFGRLPVLTTTCEGEALTLAESGAIMRFLARRFEMYGANEAESARCDALADYVADERSKYVLVAYAATMGTTQAAIDAHWEQLPQTLTKLERALGQSTDPGAGWFIGQELTFADVATFDYLDGLETQNADCLKDHSGLMAFVAQFRALPTIAPFIAERTRP